MRTHGNVQAAVVLATALVASASIGQAAPGNGSGGGGRGGGGNSNMSGSNSMGGRGRGGGGCGGMGGSQSNSNTSTYGTNNSGSAGTTMFYPGGNSNGNTNTNSGGTTSTSSNTSSNTSSPTQTISITGTVDSTSQNGTALKVTADSGERGIVLTQTVSGAQAGNRVAVTGAVSSGVLWAQTLTILNARGSSTNGQVVNFTGTVEGVTHNGTVLLLRSDSGERGTVLTQTASGAQAGNRVSITGTSDSGVVFAREVSLMDPIGNYHSTPGNNSGVAPSTGQLVSLTGTVEGTAKNGTVLMLRSDKGQRGAVLTQIATNVANGTRVAVTGALDSGVMWAQEVALVRPPSQ